MNRTNSSQVDNVKQQRPFKKLHCDWRTRLFSELKGARLAVWLYHYMRSDKDDNSRPSLNRIANDSGYDRDTVKIARKWLVNNGWLVKIDTTDANVAIVKAIFPGDDWAENPPSLNTLIALPGGKSAQAQTAVGGKSPQGQAENPPSLGGKSPRGVGGKPRQEVDTFKVDSGVDTKEVEKARADALPDSFLQTQAADAAGGQQSLTERRAVCREYFVWLNRKYLDLSLSRREKSQVREFIMGSEFDLRILSLASERILGTLNVTNSYDRACERLAENLPEKCAAMQAELNLEDENRERMARIRADLGAHPFPMIEEPEDALIELELPQAN